jgi:hypothetical protein
MTVLRKDSKPQQSLLIILCISWNTKTLLIGAQSPVVTPTFAPTTTWSPTVTPAPTYVDCNICGDIDSTAVVTANSDIIVLPPEIGQNITCQQADEAGQRGFLKPNNCAFLQEAIVAQNVCACSILNNNNNDGGTTTTTTTSPVMAPAICSVCGNASYASNRSGIIPYENDYVQCGFVEEAGKSAVWDDPACTYFQQQAIAACDCQPGSYTPASSCDICGSSDWEVGAPDAKLHVGAFEERILLGINVPPDVEPFSCQFLQTQGTLNVWTPLVCAFLQQEASKSCACHPRGTGSNSNATTMAPNAPTNNNGVDTIMTPSQSPASSIQPVTSSSSALSSFRNLALWMLVSTGNFFL